MSIPVCRPWPLYLHILIAILTLTTVPLYSQSSTAGSFARTGMTIDREERTYFGLFSDLPDFQEARLRVTDDGGLEITIDREGTTPDSIITISSSSARQLAVWFDELEGIYDGERTVDFAIMPRFVRASAPFESHAPVDVTNRSGATYSGEILYASDSALVLWPSKRTYRWREIDIVAIPFPVEAIQRIDKNQTFYYGIGGGIIVGGFASLVVQNSTEGESPMLGLLALLIPPVVGGYVGNAIGIDAEIDGDRTAYRDLFAELTSQSRFYAVPPPELRRLLDRTAAEGYRPSPSMAALRLPAQLDPPPRFHIGGGIGNAKANILAPYRLYGSSRFEELEPVVAEQTVFVEAAYSVIERIQIGAGYTVMRGGSTEPDEENREYIDIALAQGFGDFLLFVPSDRLFPNFELAVGITGIRSQSTARGRLTSGFPNSTLDTSYSTTMSGFGFGTRVRVAYHLFGIVSLELGIQQIQYSTGTVPQTVLTSSIGPIRRLEEHETDISTINTRLGARFHF